MATSLASTSTSTSNRDLRRRQSRTGRVIAPCLLRFTAALVVLTALCSVHAADLDGLMDHADAQPGTLPLSSEPTPTTPPSSCVTPTFPPPLLLQPDPDHPNLHARQAVTATPQIPANSPAGGLSFTTPAITDGLSYHKIYSGVSLTFGFTYTSVIATPASLTLEAFCSQNGNTYPVGVVAGTTVNNVVPGAATAVTWDPYAYAQMPGAIPFADATYTLRVHDERGMGVGASPGLMQPNANVRFALYAATPYTPLSEWTCAGCNAASMMKLHPLMIAVPLTIMLMVAGGWGLLGRAQRWR